MDIIDLANDRAESDLVRALRTATGAPSLTHSGQCYNCGEVVAAPRTFCDNECRDDYDHRMGRLGSRGRA